MSNYSCDEDVVKQRPTVMEYLYHQWSGFNLGSQSFELFMGFIILFLENILVIIDFLQLILSGFNHYSLMADDIFQGANEFPHLLNSTCGARECEGILTLSLLAIFG